jgi:hypothetical protein
MSNILSILAYAGDKPAARLAISQDVAITARRSVFDNDRSNITHTHAALSGNTMVVLALKVMLAALADGLKAINEGATGPLLDTYSLRVSNTRTALAGVKEAKRAGATKDAVCAVGASSFVARVVACVGASGLICAKKKSSNVDDFAAAVGDIFIAEVDLLREALKPAKKAVIEAPAADDDADTEGTPEAPTASPAMVADGVAMVDAIDALTSERDALRAECGTMKSTILSLSAENNYLVAECAHLAARNSDVAVELDTLRAAAAAMALELDTLRASSAVLSTATSAAKRAPKAPKAPKVLMEDTATA